MSYAECLAACEAATQRRLALPQPPPTRQAVRAVRAVGYKGSDLTRLTFDWSPALVPADEAIRDALPRLRARARELKRNNPYVRQYLNLLRVNVVGPRGAKLQAQVRNNDDKLNGWVNDRIETAWADWGRAPTVDGKLGHVSLQQLALETVANEGEVFVRLHRGYEASPYGLGLELLDADLLDEAFNQPAGRNRPEVRMGVEVDGYGRPIAYHFWTGPPYFGYGSPAMRERVRVPADQVLHLYDPDRVAQTRGVTWLAPVMYALNMLDGYEDAEITACRVASSAMGIWQRKEGQAGVAVPDDEGRIELEADPGTFAFAPEGYELSSWDPQHPHSNFPAFTKSIVRKVASGMGLSYNALANDLEGVNYSSMRSGLTIERDLWRSRQMWWETAYLDPIYREFLRMALLTGGLSLDTRDPRKFIAARWVHRGWQWVDPSKDVTAGIEEIGSGLGSRTQQLAKQGLDFEEVLEELKAEQELAREMGVDISGTKPATPAAPREPEPEETETEIETGRGAQVLALRSGGARG